MTKSGVVSDHEALDKRREQRMSMTRPVQLDRGTGVTRNMSTSAVFFETDVEYVQGSEIIFAIEIDGAAEEELMFRCRGEIVRVEPRDGKLGIAAKIFASRLKSRA